MRSLSTVSKNMPTKKSEGKNVMVSSAADVDAIFAISFN